jgi:cell division protein FtsB
VAARTAKGSARGRRGVSRAAGRSRRLRVLFVAGLLAAAAYLYYQPLSSYFETRNELADSRAEVEALRDAKAQLEQRLAFSTSEAATRREARRIGYIRPGEQLFIVKGIPDWRHAHTRTLRDDG